MKRGGNFLGWTRQRVGWRWNAIVRLRGFLLVRPRNQRAGGAVLQMTFAASEHHLDLCARCGQHARQHEQNAQGTVPLACPNPVPVGSLPACHVAINDNARPWGAR